MVKGNQSKSWWNDEMHAHAAGDWKKKHHLELWMNECCWGTTTNPKHDPGWVFFFPVLIRPRSKRGIIKTYYEKIRTCSHMASSEAVQTSKKTQASLMWSIAARVFSVTKWHAQRHVRTLPRSRSQQPLSQTSLLRCYSIQVPLFYSGLCITSCRILGLIWLATRPSDTIRSTICLLCFAFLKAGLICSIHDHPERFRVYEASYSL